MSGILYLYNNYLLNLGNQKVKPNSDTFKLMLVNGYGFDGSHDELLDLSAYEITSGNGYPGGGVTLTGASWARVGLKTRLDFNDCTITASGGPVGPATGAVIYSDTATDKNVVGYLDFTTSETVPDGDQFLFPFGANGLFAVEPA